MDSLQQQYWAQYEEAVGLIRAGSVQAGRDLCVSDAFLTCWLFLRINHKLQIDLVRRIDMGLYLRAIVNATLAIYSDAIGSKTRFAKECLELATMMHDQAPDNDTTWLIDHAQDLVNRINADRDEKEKQSMEEGLQGLDIEEAGNIETSHFKSTTVVAGGSTSWNGQFTKHWKAAKERAAREAGSRARTREDDSDIATIVGDTESDVGTETTEPTSMSSAIRGDESDDDNNSAENQGRV